MSARRTAVSYARFSDPKQAAGDSLARQEEMFRRFCQQNNLTPLKDVFADKGRSGFKGVHLKKGQLGDLLRAAEEGRFDEGTVVVVETWDRLGRLRPDFQTELVKAILLTGVHIGICRTGAIFQESDFGTDHWLTFSTFAYLAHQESLQKSERVKAAYQRKRENGKIVSGRLPAWLRMHGGEIVPIPENVAAVRRIFTLSAEGFGQARIIATLNAEGFKPMGRGKNGWGHSYIQLLLTDRRVLGELQPSREGNAEGAVRTDYYPRIVSDDEFALPKLGGNAQARQRGKREQKYVNTFQGMLVNALDEEGFHIRVKGKKENPRLLLASSASANGRGKHQSIPYDVFEEAILEQLKEVKPEEVLPKQQTDKPSTVETLRAKLATIRGDIASLQAEIKTAFSKALASVLRDKEAEELEVAGQLQDELTASVRPAERAWEELPSLVDLIREHGNEGRLRLRSVLRSIVEEARVLLVTRKPVILAAVQFYFHGGGVRDYLIGYRMACPGRPRSWWCAVVKEGEALLDLRKRPHVTAYEQAMRSVDLATLDPFQLVIKSEAMGTALPVVTLLGIPSAEAAEPAHRQKG
jgi:DNA invertase Pin-like site-specific DNA recombinase